MQVDLNADLGEDFGVWRMGPDEEILGLVTSANVACGFHAGDPRAMRRAVARAAARGVAVGAHPGYPDRVGFGRRPLGASPDEVENDLIYQIGALAAFCAVEGTPLHHVKPHGALYNAACADGNLARAVVRAVAAVDSGLLLYAPSGSRLAEEGRRVGLTVTPEVFADRAYDPDGRLVSRERPGAVLHDPARVAARVIRMVLESRVTAADGSDLAVDVGTVCVHGDNPDAISVLRAMREALSAAGVALAAPSREEAKER